MPMTKLFITRTSEELYTQAQQYAQQNKLKLSDVIRQAVTEYLQRRTPTKTNIKDKQTEAVIKTEIDYHTTNDDRCCSRCQSFYADDLQCAKFPHFRFQVNPSGCCNYFWWEQLEREDKNGTTTV